MIDHYFVPQANFEMALWLAAALVILVMALWGIYQALRVLSHMGSHHSVSTRKRAAPLPRIKTPR